MTSLTDKMKVLRRKAHVVTQPASYKGSDANVWREGYNQAIDKCLALAKAEASLLEIRRKLGK